MRSRWASSSLPWRSSSASRGLQLRLDAGDGALHALGTGHVVRGREHVHLRVLGEDLAGQRVQGHEPLDLVAEHLDPHRMLLVHGEHLDGVAAHAEGAAREGDVVARVLDVDEGPQQLVAVELLAHPQAHHAVDVLLRRAEAVDGGDARHHDAVAARQQAVRRRVTQPLHLLVDRGVLLDVGIALRDVGLGLVVVVVRDEVLDRVVRQQLLELGDQLRGEGLVGRHHERRPLELLDQPGRRGALAGAGGPEQDDVLLACADAAGKVGDRLGLVARRLERRLDRERGDLALQIGYRTGHPSTVLDTSDAHEPVPQLVDLLVGLRQAAGVVDDDVGTRPAGPPGTPGRSCAGARRPRRAPAGAPPGRAGRPPGRPRPRPGRPGPPGRSRRAGACRRPRPRPAARR